VGLIGLSRVSKRIPAAVDPSHSARLAKQSQKGTAPERRVGSVLRELGLVMRKNVASLPGKPDFANQKRALAIFVHGCFWHRHPGCSRTTVPKSNTWWWLEKFRNNVARDRRKEEELRRLGLEVLVVWECETLDRSYLLRLLLPIARRAKNRN
jgi:DNA mismatch endonuclease (patch repair protein)